MVVALQSLIIQYDLKFTTSLTTREANRLLECRAFHLLIIGLDYLRTSHQAEWLTDIRHISFVPLIVLSDTPDRDMNSMVQLGADLCISVQSPLAAIANRACAQLRRYTEYNHYDNPVNTEAAPFQIGGIYIDPARRVAEVYGQPVTLRRREFSPLLYFMRNHDMVLTPEQICEHAWKMEYTQSVGQSVHELHKQIEVAPNQPRHIQTVYCVGYRFVSDWSC